MSNSSQDSVGHASSRQILYRVFAWMAFAIGLSGATALIVAQNAPRLTSMMMGALMIAQLVIVMILSWRVMSLRYRTAQLLFIGYSVLTGATLSVIFAVYTLPSIATVFFISAGMFGIMALFGSFTKTDLSQYRNLLFMALIGVMIALVVNLFLKNGPFDILISIISVLLFSALTAFDIQNIQRLTQSMLVHNEDWDKVALIGALQLYLDFINLFLSLLRLFGQQRK